MTRPTRSPTLSKFLKKQEWNDAFAQGFNAGFNSDEKPAPDVSALVEALESAYHLIANHSGEPLPTNYASDQMDMINSALAAHRKGGDA